MLPAGLHFRSWGAIPLMKSEGSVKKLNYHSVNQSSFVSWYTEVKEEQTEIAFLGKCDFMFFHSFLIVKQIFVKCLHSRMKIMFKVSQICRKPFVYFTFIRLWGRIKGQMEETGGTTTMDLKPMNNMQHSPLSRRPKPDTFFPCLSIQHYASRSITH